MISGYVGIPFVDGGRDFTGCDCWGLVRLFHLKEFGNQLPAHGETPAADLEGTLEAIGAAAESPTWVKVENARRGDVVLLYSVDRDRQGKRVVALRHVGVMVDRSRLLHTEIGTNSVTVPINDHQIRGRVHSIWRHSSLT